MKKNQVEKIEIPRIRKITILLAAMSVYIILQLFFQDFEIGIIQTIIISTLTGYVVYRLLVLVKSPNYFISFSPNEVTFYLREHKSPITILKSNISKTEIELDNITVTTSDSVIYHINIIEIIDYKARMRIKELFGTLKNVA